MCLCAGLLHNIALFAGGAVLLLALYALGPCPVWFMLAAGVAMTFSSLLHGILAEHLVPIMLAAFSLRYPGRHSFVTRRIRNSEHLQTN